MQICVLNVSGGEGDRKPPVLPEFMGSVTEETMFYCGFHDLPLLSCQDSYISNEYNSHLNT